MPVPVPITELRKMASAKELRPGGKYPAYCTRDELETALNIAHKNAAYDPSPVWPIEEVKFEEMKPVQALLAPASSNGNGAESELIAALSRFVGSKAQPVKTDTTATAEDLQKLAGQIEAIKSEVEQSISGKIRELIGVIEKSLAKRRLISVKVGTSEPVQVDGKAHKLFEQIVKVSASRINILIVGPAGCGKTHLGYQISQALALPFSSISLTAGMSESALLGRYLPGTSEYLKAPFARSFETGGVFLIDEIDCADPNALLVINSALANGHLNLPNGECLKRHPDFICIASANTFGKGADRLYVGRSQLDASTLDRFSAGTFEMGYDEELERELTGDSSFCKWVQQVRVKAAAAKVRQVVSTRFIIDGQKLINLGISEADVKARFLSSWSDNDRRAVA